MSLWSNLSLGVGGLQTSSNALNTVAHNMTNVDTEGFTRQQVQQADKAYITLSKTASAISYQQVGLGVYYSNVRQVRDYFLDKTYRREAGRQDFYDVSASTLQEVQDLLGELNGASFQSSMSDLWTAVQELSKDPCNSVTQGTLVSEAAEFLSRAQAVYDGLCGYQDNLNIQVKQQVDQINEYGKRILELNSRIRLIELSGESANDMRDERNLILDKLASLANISYEENVYGDVYVQIEGEDFVKGSLVFQIELLQDSSTGFYTPFWPQNAEYTIDERGMKDYDISNALVFKLNRTISTELNTDIGKLKSMLLARGDHRADYTDIDQNYDDVRQSVLMNIQAEFDQLMHNVMTAVNDVLAESAGVTELTKGSDAALYDEINAMYDLAELSDENSYQILKVSDSNGYLTDVDGSPLQLFRKNTTDGYKLFTASDGETYWVYQKEDPAVKESLYSTTNSQINQNLLQTPTRLGFRLEDGKEDVATMARLKEVFTNESYTLNPYVLKKVNLNDYYRDLISQVANSGYVYQSILSNQQTTVAAAESARDQVTAVSSDEELSNMIKFQSAYNASSRFINVVNEMIEHLVTSLSS
ncbi:MAG: flagellar hook-associated protein FlgK [Lachnospiraceae bacterium]|nr:flagellar hook-associated protein FlgK [Lachnospiraceae bacterium]